MPNDLDLRDYSFIRDFHSAVAVEASRKKLRKGHGIIVPRVNSFIGAAEAVESTYTAAEEAPTFDATTPIEGTVSERRPKRLPDHIVIARALKHLERIAPALGFKRGQRPEFVPDPHVKTTGAGVRVVNLQQHHWGIPVFQMDRTVELDRRGRVQYVDGRSVPLPSNMEITPTVTLENAMRVAANWVNSPGDRIDSFTQTPIPYRPIDLKDYEPKVIARIPVASQPAVLEKGPFFEDVPAHLVFFYMGKDTLLGWHFLVSARSADNANVLEDQYVVIVEARSAAKGRYEPSVLYGKRTSTDAIGKGTVWRHNPKVDQRRQMIDFPGPITDSPIEPSPRLPHGFPFPWVADGGDATKGNNTTVVFEGARGPLRRTRVENGVLIFDPTDDRGDDQKVLNAFFFCNFMHDFFFMLGFDESRNFQQRNFTGIGRDGDPVEVTVTNRPVFGLANMNTKADGIKAVMRLGTASLEDARLNTGLDADIVLHEYTHGVTRRLIGPSRNPTPIQAKISNALDEGWSDYFAITIQNFSLNLERTVLGDYLKNDGATGIRLHPYDDNYPRNADVPDEDPGGVYGRIGLDPYTGADTIGEIWCAAITKMNRDLIVAFKDKVRGHRLGWRIVFDGLKKLPSNPHFIQARCHILRALDDLLADHQLTRPEHMKARAAAWRAFAHMGIGVGAQPSQPDSLETVGDKHVPEGV